MQSTPIFHPDGIMALTGLTIIMTGLVLIVYLVTHRSRPQARARSNRLPIWGGAMLLCILGLVAVAAIESQVQTPRTDFLEVVGLVLAGGLVLCAIGGILELFAPGHRAGVEPPPASTFTPSAKRLIANVVSVGAILVWGAALILCMAVYRNGAWHPVAVIGLIVGMGLIIALHNGLSRWAYPRWWQQRRKLLYPDLDEPAPLPVAKPVSPPPAARSGRLTWGLRCGCAFVMLVLALGGAWLLIAAIIVDTTGLGRLSVAAWAVVALAATLAVASVFGLIAFGNRRKPARSLEQQELVVLPTPVPLPPPPPAPPHACPKCAAPIAAGAPEGLCPRCLLQQVLPSEPRLSPTTGYGPFVPPTVAEVAEFFPQLEILGLIGQGGMGAVYLARQKALDRSVALKLIRVRDDDPTFAERFAREAKAMARLSHPNIVAVHESGEAGGLPYLVMEYVDGVTLRDAMRAKKLSPTEALAIIPQICDALEYAHRQGVVHRDVKPENILLDRAGKVKIADFGLAKLADPDGLSLTGTQQAMGTPHYMAPEQWERPNEVDHRADIYALGVVLYELLTGELPLGRFDPPSSKVQIDVRIDEVVLRALAKEPLRRYQHASDVKTALEILHASAGWVRTPTFREYRSKRTLLGWPLIHVTTGIDPRTNRPAVAKGWVAIGDSGAIGALAIAGGWSVGGLSLAGGMAAGIITLAGGAAAAAFVACAGGAAAAGGMALAGGAAFAKFVAIAGGFAQAKFALGANAHEPDFWQRFTEYWHTIWTDYLWPF